ncbi:hypothetical protein BC830DRAFT_1127353 [Chytriomyces sp. MP71]|nr:hypothetical protein BC830DRAFT_1127353 [Chytriomyces sp. MP71]
MNPLPDSPPSTPIYEPPSVNAVADVTSMTVSEIAKQLQSEVRILLSHITELDHALRAAQADAALAQDCVHALEEKANTLLAQLAKMETFEEVRVKGGKERERALEKEIQVWKSKCGELQSIVHEKEAVIAERSAFLKTEVEEATAKLQEIM